LHTYFSRRGAKTCLFASRSHALRGNADRTLRVPVSLRDAGRQSALFPVSQRRKYAKDALSLRFSFPRKAWEREQKHLKICCLSLPGSQAYFSRRGAKTHLAGERPGVQGSLPCAPARREIARHSLALRLSLLLRQGAAWIGDKKRIKGEQVRKFFLTHNPCRRHFFPTNFLGMSVHLHGLRVNKVLSHHSDRSGINLLHNQSVFYLLTNKTG